MKGDLIKKANKLKREGKLNEAIATYQQAININPCFAWYYQELGDALAKKGNLDEAIAQYCISLELKPDLNDSYKNLRKLLQVQNYSPLSIANLVSRMKESSCQNNILPSRKTGMASNSSLKLKETKVFGIGLGKTGTTTLEACFKILGYKNFSWHTVNRYKLVKQVKLNDFTDVFSLLENHQSFRDYPFPFIYKELNQKCPNSKFILTVRKDFQTWFISLVNHYNKRMEMEIWYDILYGNKYVDDENYYRNFYENHNQLVIDYFSAWQDKLIIICWENGDGWDKLCQFLNKDVPNVPLPHRNKT
ncbi:sulfotransferase [Dapis sp. BLCC M172]|uniref:sulfotransferase family protein n=1 Tax=Dapis sp. BLCC M172 TaxID=2975281 RepID=UPI003CEBF7A3